MPKFRMTVNHRALGRRRVRVEAETPEQARVLAQRKVDAIAEAFPPAPSKKRKPRPAGSKQRRKVERNRRRR
jgi:hypothetical protein